MRGSPSLVPGRSPLQLSTTGAEAIVTACPWCERNFMDAINGDGTRMKVLDVLDLVERAL